MDTYVIACDSSQLASSSSSAGADVVSQCANPYWTPQPSILPFLDATSGIAIGLSILTCWAVAFGFRTLSQQVSED